MACCNSSNRLRHVQHYGYGGPIRQLEQNLVYFLDRGLLEIGAWTDIQKDMPTLGGGDASALRYGPCSAGYNAGQVWQSFRKEWVHETDVVYTDVTGGTHSPLVPPQIYVNNVLQTSGYNIDYENGEVIFNSALAETDSVQAEYSVRNVQVYVGDEVPWWRELQMRSWDVDNNFFSQEACGDWVIGGHHRVQMPCIILDGFNRGGVRGYGLGAGCIFREQVIKFHVLAETKCDRDRLLDILVLQSQTCTDLFNVDDAAASGDLPLDCNGFYVGTKTYDQLLDDYPLSSARSDNSEITAFNTLNCGLYEGVVTTEYSLTWC